MKCEGCGDDLAVIWTTTHDASPCVTCGVPYTIFQDKVGRKVPCEPILADAPADVPLAKEYWDKTQKRVFTPLTISGAVHSSDAPAEEKEAFEAWAEQKALTASEGRE